MSHPFQDFLINNGVDPSIAQLVITPPATLTPAQRTQITSALLDARINAINKVKPGSITDPEAYKQKYLDTIAKFTPPAP